MDVTAQLRLDRRGPPPPPSPSHRPSGGEGDAKVKAEGARRICEGRRLGKGASCGSGGTMGVAKASTYRQDTQDATEDDPQSRAETQVVRVWPGSPAADQRP